MLLLIAVVFVAMCASSTLAVLALMPLPDAPILRYAVLAAPILVSLVAVGAWAGTDAPRLLTLMTGWAERRGERRRVVDVPLIPTTAS